MTEGHVRFEAKDLIKGSVKVSYANEGDDGLSVTWKEGETNRRYCECFSLALLTDCAKAKAVDQMVNLYFTNSTIEEGEAARKHPLVLEYAVGAVGNLSFWLVPQD